MRLRLVVLLLLVPLNSISFAQSDNLNLSLPPSDSSLAIFRIETIPSEANIFINDSLKGITPDSLVTMVPGLYQIKIEKEGYLSRTDSITMIAGTQRKKTYRLKPIVSVTNTSLSDPAVAAAADESKAPVKKSRIALKIGLGASSLVALVAGYVLDQQVEASKKEITSLKTAYANLPDESRYTEYQSQIDTKYQSANSRILFRNLCYGLGAVCAVSLGVTFFF